MNENLDFIPCLYHFVIHTVPGHDAQGADAAEAAGAEAEAAGAEAEAAGSEGDFEFLFI